MPEAHEVKAWGEPTFRVKNKMFAMYANANNHHGAGRHAVWIKAAAGRQARAVRTAPSRFFVPPYVGPDGWVGVWLDGACDWDELADIVRDAYRQVAPKKRLRPARGAGGERGEAEPPSAKRAEAASREHRKKRRLDGD